MVVLVPEAVLRNPPSRADDVSEHREKRLREYGVELIQRAAMLLKLPQPTFVTGAVILQRFYFRRSVAEFDLRKTAMAALLLGTKIEESQRRLKDVVLVFYRLDMHDLRRRGDIVFAGRVAPHLDIKSRIFQEMKQQVMSIERCILTELGFALGLLLEHPHKYVLQFVNSLKVDNERLPQLAWSYLNDSTRTTVACQYQPHAIAVASIYLAAKELRLKLPKFPPWWQVFDVEMNEILGIAKQLLELYRSKQPIALRVRFPRIDQTFVPPATPCDTPMPVKSPSGSDDERVPPPAASGETGVPFEQCEVNVDSGHIDELLDELNNGSVVGPGGAKRKVVLTLGRSVAQRSASSNLVG